MATETATRPEDRIALPGSPDQITAEWLTSYGTRLGQGVQAFAIWSRLSPEGLVSAYIRAVEQSRAAVRS